MITTAHQVDMIAVGSRRKNIFSRLFNPTLAHRLLFHADIPLMSIPVKG
ncbi:universal stress protein [uncultured Duncaniella sp.]|nr:universal stress protein [uncultured Duncaniella sp.]